MGPGLHERQGSTVVFTLKILSAPRYLFGTEVQNISNSDLQKLEVQQRKTLKQLQGLPTRTASAAVYTR